MVAGTVDIAVVGTFVAVGMVAKDVWVHRGGHSASHSVFYSVIAFLHF